MLVMTEREARWLTPAEVAAQLRVSVDTVLRLVRQGKLTGTKVGRQVRIRQSDLETYLRKSAGEEE